MSDLNESSQTSVQRTDSAIVVPVVTATDLTSVSVIQLLAILIESWRTILLGVVVGCLLIAAYTLRQPRTFTARITLITAGNNRGPDLSALTGGLLSGGGGGVDATPAFVMRLLKTNWVLNEVATSRTPDGQLLIDRLVDSRRAISPLESSPDLLRVISSGTDDREAGTIFIAVTHRDSALARLAVTRLVDATTQAFTRASKAQASQRRDAQDTRVATAVQRLHDAEEAQVDFARANRAVPPYSELFVRQEQLDRATQLAQAVYTQAVADRESAVAKELEEAPSLVVIEPVPPVFPRDPRRLAFKVVVTAIAAALLMSIFVIIRGLIADAGVPQSETLRLRNAIGTLPVIGRLMRRR